MKTVSSSSGPVKVPNSCIVYEIEDTLHIHIKKNVGTIIELSEWISSHEKLKNEDSKAGIVYRRIVQSRDELVLRKSIESDINSFLEHAVVEPGIYQSDREKGISDGDIFTAIVYGMHTEDEDHKRRWQKIVNEYKHTYMWIYLCCGFVIFLRDTAVGAESPMSIYAKLISLVLDAPEEKRSALIYEITGISNIPV